VGEVGAGIEDELLPQPPRSRVPRQALSNHDQRTNKGYAGTLHSFNVLRKEKPGGWPGFKAAIVIDA
jgi:hypothetical protein